MEEVGDGAHATGGDEQDEETDDGVLDHTGGGSFGGWAIDGHGLDSGGDGDGSVKPDGSDDGEPLEEEDLPLDVLQILALSDGGDDNEEGENAEDLELLLQQAVQPRMTRSTGLPTMSALGSPRRLTLSQTGWPCRHRHLRTWSKTLWLSTTRKSKTYLERRCSPC